MVIIIGKGQKNFNPRSPSGLRRATLTPPEQTLDISIHAARVGCDCFYPQRAGQVKDFNPRSPSGLRLLETEILKISENFNPRSPSGLRLELLMTI